MSHAYIIGATGVGKTTYLLSRPSPEASFIFIDKHGDAARALADAYPCIYWEAAKLTHIVSYNPLQNVAPDQRWKRTADLVSIFSDIWKLGPETPRLLYYLRAAIRLLLDSERTTLLDIRRLLSDDNYRARLLARCRDSETRQTWLEYEAKKEQQQAQEIASLQNKVAALADPLPLRLILGQPTSTINFESIMRDGFSLVLNLAGMGDEPAHLLGAIVLNSVKQAAEHVRRPYEIYVDEFQNFGTSVIATMLSESRKFGIDLTLAHQFISQLDPDIRDAVLGNCSTLISFRVGPEDAPIIGKALDLHPQVLQDLPDHHAFYRTVTNRTPTSALPLPKSRNKLPTGMLGRNIRFTEKRFARPRHVAEALLNGKRPPRKKPRWA